MKIEKGYTLSQFIDEIDKYVKESDNITRGYIKIQAYNDFLKQPLTKEMFVNECTLPDEPMLCKSVLALDEFPEAEKKVIFEGFKQSTYSKYFIINGTNEINFSNSDFIVYHRCDKEKYYKVNIIHDLFEATNGELKLKNVIL